MSDEPRFTDDNNPQPPQQPPAESEIPASVAFMEIMRRAAAKARGVKLGNPNGARALRGKQVGNADAVAKIKANAAQRALDLAGIVSTR